MKDSVSKELINQESRLLSGMGNPQIIDGKKVSGQVLEQCREEIAALAEEGKVPGLAVVLVGDDPASRAYVRSKDKTCQDLGVHSVKLEMPEETTHE